MKNYFFRVILAWKTNLDIQPVFNDYNSVAYMYSYLSKSEDEYTQTISQAVKDAF